MKFVNTLLMVCLCVNVGAGEQLPKGSFETGLFQPLKFGYSDNMELSTHPVFMFVIPNFGIQKQYPEWNGFSVSSRHSLVIPTPLLRMVSNKGIGGFISPEFDIPFMVSIKNEIGLHNNLPKNMSYAVNAGITLAYSSDELDERTTIDLPLIFPRMAVFYNGFGVNFGVIFQGSLSSKLSMLTDMNFLFLPGAKEDLAIEHKSLLTWKASEEIRYQIGYKLVYGKYPFGDMWHLLPIPLFDIIWSW